MSDAFWASWKTSPVIIVLSNRYSAFSKFLDFNIRPVLQGPMGVIVPNFTKIGRTVAEISRFKLLIYPMKKS